MDEDQELENQIREAMNTTEVPVEREEPVELPVEQGAPEGGEGENIRARGADGKFVAKEEESAQDASQEPEPAEPPKEAIRPPAGWTPQAKAKFAALDPDIQKEVLKRERDFATGLEERTARVKRYEPLETLIAPHRDKWAMAGMDEVTAIGTLIGAHNVLETKPIDGIQHLMRAYNVSLAQLAGQPQQAQPVAQQPQQDNALLQRIAALESSIQAGQTATYQTQIEAFQADPKNLYFENVRDDMAALIQTGKAKDLPEAYEMACWMRPDIRPLLQIPQPAPDRARAEKARNAGSSVTGSPTTAPVPALLPTNAADDIENDLRNAVHQLSSRP